jgi:hypothetical protein
VAVTKEMVLVVVLIGGGGGGGGDACSHWRKGTSSSWPSC